MADTPLHLLHLSDIHFCRGYSGSAFDLDRGLRDELERDAESLVTNVGPVSGILITGDVAFSGAESEYSTAHEWLKRLSVLVGCPSHRVWTVPGNHDVDRRVVGGSTMLQTMHRDVRVGGADNIDRLLEGWARDPIAGPAILSPLSNYVRFADQFGCGIGRDGFFWQQDLSLNDGSVLRVRGVTSTIISDESDSDGDDKLALGEVQMVAPREPGVEFLIMCHHPPSWLHDYDKFENFLRRFRIQLFGHKHQQHLDLINENLRLAAGAVHPSREERPWEPRYNLLSVQVVSGSGKRRLRVDVYPRVWDRVGTKFMPGQPGPAPYFRFEPELPDWRAEAPEHAATSSGGTGAPSISSPKPEAIAPGGGLVDARRRLVYRFYGLSYVVRLDIARRLGLVEDVDAGISDSEFGRRVFERARTRNLLGDLWEAVEARYSDPASANPFRF